MAVPNYHPEEITPVGSPECLTPRATTPTNANENSQQNTYKLHTSSVSTSPITLHSACQYNWDDLSEPKETSTLTEHHVSLSDANCQTSIVFEENRSSRDTSTDDFETGKSLEECSVQCDDVDIQLSLSGDDSWNRDGNKSDEKDISESKRVLAPLCGKFLDKEELCIYQETPTTAVILDTELEKRDSNQLESVKTNTKPSQVPLIKNCAKVENCDESIADRDLSFCRDSNVSTVDRSAKRKILKNLTDANFLVSNILIFIPQSFFSFSFG